MPALEGMRGLASAWVTAYHLWVVLGIGTITVLGLDITGLLEHGGVGVDFFFVLSGFLLALPFLRADANGSSVSLSSYARRRLFRIVPAYYACAAILSIWPAPSAHGGAPPIVDLPVILAHAVFAPFLAMKPALNGVFWSLSTEMQFYFALPFLVRLFRGGRWALGLAVCVAVAVGWRLLLYVVIPPNSAATGGVDTSTYLAMVMLPGRLDGFGAGITLAVIWLRHGGPARRWGAMLSTATGMAIIWLDLAISSSAGEVTPDALRFAWYLFGQLPLPLGFALIVYGSLGTAWGNAPLWTCGPIQHLGKVSYSVYLWHLPVMTTMVMAIGRPDGLGLYALVAAVVAAVMLVATVSYACVEHPFLDGGRRLLGLTTRARASRASV